MQSYFGQNHRSARKSPRPAMHCTSCIGRDAWRPAFTACQNLFEPVQSLIRQQKTSDSVRKLVERFVMLVKLG